MIKCPLCGKEADLVAEDLRGFPALRCSECGKIVAFGTSEDYATAD